MDRSLRPFFVVGAIASVAVGQQFSAEQHRLLPSTAAANAMAVGDIDGDGDLDLASGGWAADYRLAANDGHGRFVPTGGTLNPGPFLSAAPLAFGDIDGDGDLDLVRAASGSIPAGVWRNDGQVGFTNVSSQWIAGTEWPSHVVFVDWDGDGDQDIVTCNYSVPNHHTPPNSLPSSRIYTNNGAGVFSLSPWIAYGERADTGVAVGDLDGDGDPDLVFSVGGVGTVPSTIRVHLQGVGHSAVATVGVIPVPVPTLGEYLDVALFDFDLDGDLDLAVASTLGAQIYANDGVGGFTLASVLAGDRLSRWTTGDFDGDGRIDLLAVRQDRREFLALPPILYANTVAGFVDVTATHLESAVIAPTSFIACDADQDGDLDLLGGSMPAAVIWFNDGQGHLRDVADHALMHSTIRRAFPIDVEGDGDIDVVTVEESYRGFTQLAFAENDGRGPHAGKILLKAWRDGWSRSVAWLDADLDGDQDLFVPGSPADRLYHWTAGQLVDVTAAQWPVTTLSLDAMAVDVDVDSRPDLVLTSVGGVKLLRNGVGGFVDASVALAGTVPPFTVGTMAALDYDADGDPDLVFANGNGVAAPVVLRNDWPAPFVDVTTSLGLGAMTADAVATIDIDRDGRLDLLFGPVLSLQRSVGAGFVDESTTRLPTGPLIAHFLTVVDFDGDGWDDVLSKVSEGGTTFRLRNVQGVLVSDGFASLPVVPVVADLDGDGDVDLIDANGLVRNRTRQLQSAVPPRLGAPSELVVHAYGGNGVDPQAALLFVAPQLAPAPVVVPGFGSLYLDPATTAYLTTVVIPGTGGETAIPYAVPSVPSVLGVPLFVQAAFAHEPNPATWRLGNHVDLTVRL